jgi:hypothetical protein
MHFSTYDGDHANQNPYERWSEVPGGWDGFTDELGDEPTVTCRPGPWWPVVVHYVVRAALLVTLIVMVVR